MNCKVFTHHGFYRDAAFFDISSERPKPGQRVLHKSRDPRHCYCLARGASQREFQGFHESRDTKHETRLFQTRNTAFPVARLVHGGTEALQSCFFRPGLLGNRTGRRSPCGSRIRASQAFTRPQATDSKAFTKHELRDTSHGLYVFTNHETRNTNHGFLCFFRGSYGTVGTEALQSFFRVPDGLA